MINVGFNSSIVVVCPFCTFPASFYATRPEEGARRSYYVAQTADSVLRRQRGIARDPVHDVVGAVLAHRVGSVDPPLVARAVVEPLTAHADAVGLLLLEQLVLTSREAEVGLHAGEVACKAAPCEVDLVLHQLAL